MNAKTFSIALVVLLLVMVLMVPAYAVGKPKPSYVIITTNEIVYNSQRLQNFISMKFNQGFRVKVVTEDDFDHLVGQAPNGRAEKIRQWLINNYEQLNIKYVLLIGDPHAEDIVHEDDYIGDIPMKRCWGNYATWWIREGLTDFFYADLTSNWDADGDTVFCERHLFDTPESPQPGTIDADNFWVKWEGQLKCDSTGDYRISTFSDGGVAVMIDGKLVICDECITYPPVEHPPELKDETVSLQAGLHNIDIWYTERYGDAFMQLLWTPPGTPLDQRPVIPETHLQHQTAFGQQGGLIGYYYNGIGDDTPGYNMMRLDKTINFTWATGDIKDGALTPEPEVYVGRIPVYIPNQNRFADLDLILGKIIDYETDSSDISWRKSMLLPFKLVPEYANMIADLRPPTWSSTTIYDQFIIDPQPNDLPPPDIWYCTAENVVNEWINGYGMVVWAAHGHPRGAPDVIDINWLSQLNDIMPSFTIHGSCNTGYPEDSYNLGYSLLKKGDGVCKCGGGIANIAGGRETILSIEQLQYPYTIPNILNEGMPAGMALCEAKAQSNAEAYPGHVDSNDILFNLYGDPNIHLQKTFPIRVVEDPICGDVTSDGVVDRNDLWGAYPWGTGAILSKWAADVNCDGAVTRADSEAIELYLMEGVPLQCCFDISILARQKLFGARNYILDLPVEMFKKQAAELKNALSNKFYALHELIDTGNYRDAYMKMEKDIRTKMDGLEKDDWITDPVAQKDICGMLDNIEADLQVLIDQP